VLTTSVITTDAVPSQSRRRLRVCRRQKLFLAGLYKTNVQRGHRVFHRDTVPETVPGFRARGAKRDGRPLQRQATLAKTGAFPTTITHTSL
jgi:hypothetical protein